MKHLTQVAICGIGHHFAQHVSPGHSLMREIGEEPGIVLINGGAKERLQRAVEIALLDMETSHHVFVIDDGHYTTEQRARDLAFELINRPTGDPIYPRGLPHGFTVSVVAPPSIDELMRENDNFDYNHSSLPSHNREQVKVRGKGYQTPKDNRKAIKAARKLARKSKSR